MGRTWPPVLRAIAQAPSSRDRAVAASTAARKAAGTPASSSARSPAAVRSARRRDRGPQHLWTVTGLGQQAAGTEHRLDREGAADIARKPDQHTRLDQRLCDQEHVRGTGARQAGHCVEQRLFDPDHAPRPHPGSPRPTPDRPRPHAIPRPPRRRRRRSTPACSAWLGPPRLSERRAASSARA